MNPDNLIPFYLNQMMNSYITEPNEMLSSYLNTGEENDLISAIAEVFNKTNVEKEEDFEI